MKCFVLDGEFAPKDGYSLSPREQSDRRASCSSSVWRNLSASLIERPMPTLGEKDVLIQVGACGICGSDMHAADMDSDGYTLFSGHMRLPVILGHEFAGKVVSVGNKVTRYRPGDLIAAEQIRWCGECLPCRSGMPNSCECIEEVGLSSDGAFSEYAIVPERFCVSINHLADYLGDELAAMEAGALSEPTGVAYMSMIAAGGGITPGTNVAVFGTGPIGLAAIAIARASGAAKIFAFSRNDKKLELAKTMGADHAINCSFVSASEAVLELTNGVGCKTVVEAAGSPTVLYPEIAKLMCAGARICQIGMSAEVPPVPLMPFIAKQCTISGSLGTAGSGVIPNVINMMASGAIDMRKIISGRFALDNIEEGINFAKSGVAGKVMISPLY